MLFRSADRCRISGYFSPFDHPLPVLSNFNRNLWFTRYFAEISQKKTTQPSQALKKIVQEDRNPLRRKLQKHQSIIAVEFDPPANCEIERFMNNAEFLKEAGVDAVTIADCPIARARVDSSLLACKLHRELALDIIPHMTCRDRNINATKALLFGLDVYKRQVQLQQSSLS